MFLPINNEENAMQIQHQSNQSKQQSNLSNYQQRNGELIPTIRKMLKKRTNEHSFIICFVLNTKKIGIFCFDEKWNDEEIMATRKNEILVFDISSKLNSTSSYSSSYSSLMGDIECIEWVDTSHFLNFDFFVSTSNNQIFLLNLQLSPTLNFVSDLLVFPIENVTNAPINNIIELSIATNEKFSKHFFFYSSFQDWSIVKVWQIFFSFFG